MQSILNQPKQKTIRRKLRQQPVKCEKLLWSKLRNRRLGGYKFRRQYSIGHYVVDFYCSKVKLVIEIDEATHSTKSELKYDKERQRFIEKQGIKVIRYYNSDIKNNIEAVLESVLENCNERLNKK